MVPETGRVVIDGKKFGHRLVLLHCFLDVVQVLPVVRTVLSLYNNYPTAIQIDTTSLVSESCKAKFKVKIISQNFLSMWSTVSSS